MILGLQCSEGAANPGSRVDCNENGRSKCEEAGCCWDPQGTGNTIPKCFRPDSG